METAGTKILTKTKWVSDKAHSKVMFTVKHLMITNVTGEFKTFYAEINAIGNNFSRASIFVNIDPASISTNNDVRDTHLKNPDFFDIKQFKELTFKGSSFDKIDDKKFQLKGDLTMKGISKEITLDVEFGGINKDASGNEKAGFSVSGIIYRKDWGIIWNSSLETGGNLVSDEVKINAEIQFIKQA